MGRMGADICGRMGYETGLIDLLNLLISPTQLVLRRSAEVLRESSWARARSEWRGSRSGTFGERNRPSRGQWAPILARRRDKRPTLAPSHSRIGSARFLSFKVGT